MNKLTMIIVIAVIATALVPVQIAVEDVTASAIILAAGLVMVVIQVCLLVAILMEQRDDKV